MSTQEGNEEGTVLDVAIEAAAVAEAAPIIDPGTLELSVATAATSTTTNNNNNILTNVAAPSTVTSSPPHSGNRVASNSSSSQPQSSTSLQKPTPPQQHTSSLISDLVRAIQGDDWDDLCDVHLICSSGASVPACRLVLAARSKVFRRMLYGSFREAKSSSIALLGYAEPILRAVVYYCVWDALDPSFARSVHDVPLQLQLHQAADYLQLPILQQIMEQHILRHMAKHAGLVCTTVFNETAQGSPLCTAAWHMMECRPYVTLSLPTNTGSPDDSATFTKSSSLQTGVTALSAEKLEYVLKSTSIGCSEWFLFQQLSRWYYYQLSILPESEQALENSTGTGSFTDHTAAATGTASIKTSDNEKEMTSTNSNGTTPHDKLLFVTRELCARYIRLANIEPSMLLSSSVKDCPFVSPQAIFDAVSSQALSASQHGVWRLHYRGLGSNSDKAQRNSSGGNGSVDRVLVEGAGAIDVDGMYYRIAQGCLSNDSDLYTKREVAVGQQYVYTLSRCLRNGNNAGSGGGSSVVSSNTNDGSTDKQSTGSSNKPYYECRIFGSKFLTHNAVQSLRTMQSTASIVPCFQPVLQVLELTPPLVAAGTATATATSSTTSPSGSNTATTTAASSSSDGILSNASSFDSVTALGAAATTSSALYGTYGSSSTANSSAVPRPIRKYYRVRLSDGDYHMPGTLAPELNVLVENGDLKEKRVLQVLEFGVYTIFGCTGIHVMKAVVVTTTPSYVFGDPVPLEDMTVEEQQANTNAGSHGDGEMTTSNGLQNLYTHRCSAVSDDDGAGGSGTSIRIPKTGWQVDAHGQSPAPECTWIPAAVAPAHISSTSGSGNASVAASSTAANSSSSSRMRGTTGNTTTHNVVNNTTSSTSGTNSAAAMSTSTSGSPRRAGGSSPRSARINF